jgi:hypothetical protein
VSVVRIHEVGLPAPIISGVAEIRDKDGNLKGTFTFGGPVETVEKAEAIYNELKGDGDGRHTDDSRS